MKPYIKTLVALIFLLTSSCLFFDPCIKDCGNNGYCDDGDCVCPDRFYGTFCEDQKEPSSIEITNIKILEFSMKDNDSIPYDTSDGPDLYLTIRGGDFEYEHGTIFQNAVPGTQYNFIPIEPVIIENVNEGFEFFILDKDGSVAYDIIGDGYFKYDSKGGFPDKVVSNSWINHLVTEISLKYIF